MKPQQTPLSPQTAITLVFNLSFRDRALNQLSILTVLLPCLPSILNSNMTPVPTTLCPTETNDCAFVIHTSIFSSPFVQLSVLSGKISNSFFEMLLPLPSLTTCFSPTLGSLSLSLQMYTTFSWSIAVCQNTNRKALFYLLSVSLSNSLNNFLISIHSQKIITHQQPII